MFCFCSHNLSWLLIFSPQATLQWGCITQYLTPLISFSTSVVIFTKALIPLVWVWFKRVWLSYVVCEAKFSLYAMGRRRCQETVTVRLTGTSSYDRCLEGRARSSMGRYGIVNPRYFLKHLSNTKQHAKLGWNLTSYWGNADDDIVLYSEVELSSKLKVHKVFTRTRLGSEESGYHPPMACQSTHTAGPCNPWLTHQMLHFGLAGNLEWIGTSHVDKY